MFLRIASLGAGLIAGAVLLMFLPRFAPTAEPTEDKQPVPQSATIHADKLPLAQVLDELARQTSERAADQMGDPDPVLDIDFKQMTFWEALDALSDKAGGRLDLHAKDGGVAIATRPAGWRPAPVSHSGLFRISLNAITSKLDLDTDARACTASVEVAWEPHLLPLLLDTRPHGLTVRDDAGKAVAAGPVTSSLAPVDGRNSLAFDVTLPPAPRAVQKLSLLEGEFYAVAPTKMLTFTFDALERPAAATQEGVECRVGKVAADDDHWSVAIDLAYPEGNVKLDSYQSWVVNNDIYLERKDGGDRFLSSSYLLEGSTPRRASLVYNFSDKEKMKRGLVDWRLVYRTPALVVKVPIAFSFKDVPLP